VKKRKTDPGRVTTIWGKKASEKALNGSQEPGEGRKKLGNLSKCGRHGGQDRLKGTSTTSVGKGGGEGK